MQTPPQFVTNPVVVDPFEGAVLGGRYQVVRRVGEGGMGVVYEGKHVTLGKRVAIKTLHPQFAKNAESLSRFLQEARAATSVGNEHIIDVQDIDRAHDGSVYMVMEFLDGRSLADAIASVGAMTLGRACHIALQISDALAAVHAMGIVHRDLKPENIILLNRGKERDFVKIVDFGISKILDGEHGARHVTRTGMPIGTPHFMSPEQAEGRRDLDHRTDIYALGVILYNMLTGTLPFDADSLPSVLLKICSQPIPDIRVLRPDLPPEFTGIISQFLAKDRNYRPSGSERVRALLEPYESVQLAPAIVQTFNTGDKISYNVTIPQPSAFVHTIQSSPQLPTTESKSISLQKRLLIGGGALTAGVLIMVGLFSMQEASYGNKPSAPTASPAQRVTQPVQVPQNQAAVPSIPPSQPSVAVTQDVVVPPTVRSPVVVTPTPQVGVTQPATPVAEETRPEPSAQTQNVEPNRPTQQRPGHTTSTGHRPRQPSEQPPTAPTTPSVPRPNPPSNTVGTPIQSIL